MADILFATASTHGLQALYLVHILYIASILCIIFTWKMIMQVSLACASATCAVLVGEQTFQLNATGNLQSCNALIHIKNMTAHPAPSKGDHQQKMAPASAPHVAQIAQSLFDRCLSGDK